MTDNQLTFIANFGTAIFAMTAAVVVGMLAYGLATLWPACIAAYAAFRVTLFFWRLR